MAEDKGNTAPAHPAAASSSAPANPYAAPQSAVDDAPIEGFELASRGERFAAAIIDGLCFGGLGILAAVLAPSMKGTGETVVYAAVGIAFLVVAGINLRLLYTSAATIGKRAMKIRVARTDGSQPSLSRLIFMRGLPQWLISAIPYIGNLFSLVDSLFIFSSARRCVHDYIADTIVIKAPAAA
jgi:uncharacterized RDD family membrane protein YckC